MPHIALPEDAPPGIRGLMLYRQDTGRILMELAEALLRAPSSLTPGERELVAAHVSTKNDCSFCAGSHAAFAAAQLDGGAALVETARRDPSSAPISPKMKALLAIAGEVQESGKPVKDASIAKARAEGATDRELHDVVLIAAAFSMFNRYVDGLATRTPDDPRAYEAMAKVIVETGYVR